MGDGYTKLFSDIVDSSIWDEDSDIRVVWVTLLALCNADGFVRGSVGWLAGKAHVSPDKCQEALTKFAAPDPQSRTPDNDGRRIEVLEDGWLILNYLLFRDRLSANPKAVKTRERVRKHRERYAALRNDSSVTCVTPSHSASASVSESSSGIKEGAGNHQGEIGNLPTDDQAAAWLADTRKSGSDYQAGEMRSALLSLRSNGGMWGRNPITDWRAALERQIQTDRQRNGHGAVSPSVQVVLDTKDLERTEAEIKRISESVDSHIDLPPEDRAKRKKLREHAEILKKKLQLTV